MIVVEKAKLKFLRAGRPIQVDVPRLYRKGREYAVRRPEKHVSVCRAMVLDVFEVEPGTWRLTLRYSAQDRPRLLAARMSRGDYTDRPDLAAKGEPEALSPADLERYVSKNRARDQERMDAERAARPRSARVTALERAAAAGDQQAKRHLFVIDQRIDAHERGGSRSQTG